MMSCVLTDVTPSEQNQSSVKNSQAIEDDV